MYILYIYNYIIYTSIYYTVIYIYIYVCVCVFVWRVCLVEINVYKWLLIIYFIETRLQNTIGKINKYGCHGQQVG